MTDALKGLSQSQAMHIQVGVHINHGLLSMNIESVDVQKEELMDILKAYKKKRKFYKLKNGKIVSLENKEFKELDELTSTLQLKSQDIVNGVVEIPAYRLFELDQFMNQESSIQYSRSEEFKKWTNELVESPRSFDIPDQYTDILR